MQTNQEDNK